MYVLKQPDGTFYVIKMDSYGYTVDWVTQDRHGATRFETRKEAEDVRSSLDEYWYDQCKVAVF